MNIAELTAKIEAMFPLGPSTPTLHAVTGEPYVEIGFQVVGGVGELGTVIEGGMRATSSDEDRACNLALDCFEVYSSGRKGKLYWRTHPVLCWNENRTRCHVYMRCLVSDKPEMAAAAA